MYVRIAFRPRAVINAKSRFDLRRRGEGLAAGVGPERAVRDAADVKLLPAAEEELPARVGSCSGAAELAYCGIAHDL